MDAVFNFWNGGYIWIPQSMVLYAYQEYQVEGITTDCGIVDSTVTDYGFLIIMAKGVCLELFVITGKSHWLKSYPYLMQDVLNVYPAGKM